MAEKQFKLDYNGQAVQQQDFASIGEVSGLADDRVFAELLRMVPYDGSTVSKGILPVSDSTNPGLPTVFLSGFDGKVKVSPFRAFVGSRTAVGTDTKENLRDIRSAIFVGASTLHELVSLSANASGNPRWDLVYATVVVDTDGDTTTRKVKSPTTGVITDETVSVSTETTVALGTVVGTPAASPSWPTLPSDSGSTYYIPLAYVRVPNGFTASSIVFQNWIAEAAPLVSLSKATGANTVEFADQHYTGGGSLLTTASIQAWGASGTPPDIFVRPQAKGGETLLIFIDLNTPVHVNGTVVDSRDWSGRVCRWTCASGAAGLSPPWRGEGGAPNAELSSHHSQDISVSGLGQTMFADENYLGVGEGAFAAQFDGVLLSHVHDDSRVGIYCDLLDGGKLKFYATTATAPGTCTLFFWIDFSAPIRAVL